MARGRKPKNKMQESPTVQALVDKVTEVDDSSNRLVSNTTEINNPLEIKWDVRIGDPIDYFDSNLSYELTGYRPIDGINGLDFNPDWFMEARRNKASTGKYCNEPKFGKAYGEFWDQEYDRCRNGMTVNGYTITGDNYYFINYYQLPNLSSATKAGGGRSVDFPNFFVKQYEYFHYIELCKVLRKNAIGLKARGVK